MPVTSEKEVKKNLLHFKKFQRLFSYQTEYKLNQIKNKKESMK